MWSGDYRAFSDPAYTDLSTFEHPSFLVNNNSNNKTNTQTRNEMPRFLLAFWRSFRPSFSLVLEIENAPDWLHLPFPGYFWRCVIITLVFSLHFRAFSHGRHMQEKGRAFPKTLLLAYSHWNDKTSILLSTPLSGTVRKLVVFVWNN